MRRETSRTRRPIARPIGKQISRRRKSWETVGASFLSRVKAGSLCGGARRALSSSPSVKETPVEMNRN
jgi:hypothetical protein